MRKLAIAFSLLLLLGVGGYFGLKAYAENYANVQIDALFAGLRSNGITATHGAVTVDPLRRALSIPDVRISVPEPNATTLAIGEVKAEGLALADGRLSAGRIALSALDYEGPELTMRLFPASYRVPELSIENVSGPLAPPPAGSGNAALLAVLKSIAADKIAVPAAKVVNTIGTDPALRTEYDYTDITLYGLADGLISAASVGRTSYVTQSSAAAGAATVKGAIGGFSARGVDLAAHLIVFGTVPPPDDSFRQLYDRMAFDALTVETGDGGRQTVGSAVTTGFAMRPLVVSAPELSRLVETWTADQAANRTPTPAEVQTLLATVAGVVDGTRVDGVELRDFAVSAPKTPDVRMAMLRFGPLQDGRLATFALEQVDIAAADGAPPGKIGRIAINGLRPADMLRRAGELAQDPGAASRPDSALALLRLVEGIELAAIEFAPDKTADGLVKLDVFHLSWLPSGGLLPTRIAGTLRLEGPISELDAQEPFALMAAAGATRASLELDLGAAWNEAERSVTVSPLHARVPGAFSAAGSVRLGDVDKEVFSDAPAPALAAAGTATFRGADFTLIDEGIYELKLKQVAEEQGATPDAVRDLVGGIAEMMAQEVVTERPELEPATKAILDFLQAPKGKLAVKLTPRGEQPVLDLLDTAVGNPAALLEAVDIEATATR
ncbi:MAG TPA: hypothetical protein VLA00_17050 [Xanthobacteraceae bacterium]|nr:hypothetical protein [Xanthobacteraceae bacterium]